MLTPQPGQSMRPARWHPVAHCRHRLCLHSSTSISTGTDQHSRQDCLGMDLFVIGIILVSVQQSPVHDRQRGRLYLFISIIFIFTNPMRFLVTFHPSLHQQPMHKHLPSSDPLDNLYIHISLTYQDMDNCKLVYRGAVLKDKTQPLHAIFPKGDEEQEHEVMVVGLGELEAMGRDVGRSVGKWWGFVSRGQNRELGYCLGVGLVVLVIALMGVIAG